MLEDTQENREHTPIYAHFVPLVSSRKVSLGPVWTGSPWAVGHYQLYPGSSEDVALIDLNWDAKHVSFGFEVIIVSYKFSFCCAVADAVLPAVVPVDAESAAAP